MGRAGRGRRWLLGLTALLVVVALAIGAVLWERGDLPSLSGLSSDDDPAASSTSSAPGHPLPDPAGPALPSAAPPAPVAAPVAATDAGALAPPRVRRALAPWLDDRRLGRHVVVQVADLSGGPPVFRSGSGAVIPASTTKLLTAAAALHWLGPEHVFTTRVVATGGGVVLVGGGDPLLASRPVRAAERGTVHPPRADVVTLARETASALEQQGRKQVRVGYDASLFPGQPGEDTWEPDYLPDDVVSPISALWVDEGRDPDGFGRVDDPAATAAAVFARALGRQGIRVVGSPAPARASADADTVAEVESAPLDLIVERVLVVSDNEAAEVLGHHVGIAAGAGGTFEGGVRGVEVAMGELDVTMAGAELHDGSGLSRANRLTAPTLIDLLRTVAAADQPSLRAVLTGLPVAGFTGSLTYRFTEGPPAGPGQVRAKTGTLTAVSGLAGLATDRTGTTMVFVMVADRVRRPNTLVARQTLDGAAAALAACRCGG